MSGTPEHGGVIPMAASWLPAYPVKTAHMNILKSAEYTTIPWTVAAATDLAVGGWLVGYLIRRGGRETTVRKTILVGGMLLGLAVFGAALTTDPRIAIVLLGRIEPIPEPPAVHVP